MNGLSKFINMRNSMSSRPSAAGPQNSTQNSTPQSVADPPPDIVEQQPEERPDGGDGSESEEQQIEGIFDSVPEPLTPDPEAVDRLTDEPTVFLPNTPEDEGPKMARLRDGISAAVAGFDSTVWSWTPEDVPQSGGALLGEVIEKTQTLFEALRDERTGTEILRRVAAERKKDRRLCTVSFGMILMCLTEAGLTKTPRKESPMDLYEATMAKPDGMRPWQRLLVLQIAKYFADVSLGIVTQYDESKTFPQFLETPLFSLPTGSGKSFAGIITALCSAIRVNGEDIKLMHPHNAKALWCTPTRITAYDVARKMQAIASTPTFRQLMPGNFGAEMDRLVVTIGAGEEAPRIREKMFCVMTYEYARTQLISAIVDDKGDPRARRQPLIAALRCVIVDEAHILVKSSERSRAFVADNILVACSAMRIPTVMLTATGSPQFKQFVAQYYPSPGDFGEGQQREFPIFAAAVPVMNATLDNKAPLSSEARHEKQDELIDQMDKLIVFRCVTETFFKPQQDSDTQPRSIVFIQSIRGVLLVAAYAAGLYVAFIHQGVHDAVCEYLVDRAEGYLATDSSLWEDAFTPRDVMPSEMLTAFLQGVEDVVGPISSGLRQNAAFRQATAKDMFIAALAMSNNVVPVFSGFAKAGVPQTRFDNMLMGSGATYRVIVATSLILEGVNLEGADNLYVTPQGYKCLTDTQYTQLCGRVGRTKEGYVETWVPVRRQPDSAILPVKNESVIRSERSGEVDRVAETDDLIDRVLFLKKLVSMLRCHVPDYDELVFGEESHRKRWTRSGTDPWGNAVRMLSENSLRNNYFRGLVRPRITSFFTPASVSEELFAAEAEGEDVPLGVYEDFVNLFAQPQYRIFFAVFRDASFNASSPRLTLDTISFILALGGLTPDLPQTELALLPSILLIPVFTQYSYAFNPKFKWADYSKLDNKDCCALRSLGYDIETVSGQTGLVSFLNKIVSRVLPGVLLNPSSMKNVEQASLLFAESLLVDPLIWKRVTGQNFVNMLQFMLSYLRTVDKVFQCREGCRTIGAGEGNSEVEWEAFDVSEECATRLWTLLSIVDQVVQAVKSTIEQSDAKSSAYAMNGIADPLRDQCIKIKPGGGYGSATLQLRISYYDFINGCLGEDAKSIAQKAEERETSESAIFDRHKQTFYNTL